MTARGILGQRQRGYAVVRLNTAGRITSKQFRKLYEVAKDLGKGYALITMRKGIELPWIKKEMVRECVWRLEETDLRPGSSGREVRSIVTCAGEGRCPFFRGGMGSLVAEIGARYYGRSMPSKFDITLCGCPNYCSHPYLNDVGIIGKARPKINREKCIGCGQCVRLCRGDRGGAIMQRSVDPPLVDYEKCIECGWCIANCPTGAMEAEKEGCTIIVGGRGGAKPKLAVELVKIVSEEEALEILGRIFNYVKEHSKHNERLSDLIEREGLERFKEYVLQPPVPVVADGGGEDD
jgi:dissimilatory sulfite reductase (desulfoviridin) alpha/beta subunit